MAKGRGAGEAPQDQHIRWWEVFIVVPIGGQIAFAGLLAVALGMAALAMPAEVQGFLRGLSPQNLGGDRRSVIYVFLPLAELGLLLMAGFVVRGRRHLLVAAYARPASRTTIAIAAFMGVALAILFAALGTWLEESGAVDFRPTPEDIAMSPRNPVELLFLVAAGGLLAPFVEELYFRGIVLTWLKQAMPVAAAALVSAALFALVHAHLFVRDPAEAWVLTAGLFAVGFVLALWAIGTRSLWPPMALHAAYNTVLFTASYVLAEPVM